MLKQETALQVGTPAERGAVVVYRPYAKVNRSASFLSFSFFGIEASHLPEGTGTQF